MKKLNRVLSTVLATAMVVSMAGCGSGANASSDTFKIGGIGPITGSGAAYGLGV